MEKAAQLYEGKAKKVFATGDPALVIVSYKDDATAFNGEKKGTIAGKGVINNKMSNLLMQMLEQNGVPTHFVKELSDRDTVVKKDVYKRQVLPWHETVGTAFNLLLWGGALLLALRHGAGKDLI